MLNHILCADDDPDMRMILEVALGAMGGWRVTLCADGEEMLAEAQADPPDLILLDAFMPGMDGRTAITQLRAHPQLSKIPVAFVTGHAAPSDVAELRALGAIGVLAKPFNPMELPALVRALWNSRPQ